MTAPRGVATRCAILALLLAASPAQAARQGEIGEVSEGYINIRVTVAPRLAIRGVNDANLARGAAVQPACVETNSATGRYAITGSGSGTGGAFALTGDSGQALPFAAAWGDAGGGVQPLLPGKKVNAASGVAECSATRGNAALRLAARAQDNAGSADTYAGALTLVIAPL